MPRRSIAPTLALVSRSRRTWNPETQQLWRFQREQRVAGLAVLFEDEVFSHVLERRARSDGLKRVCGVLGWSGLTGPTLKSEADPNGWA